MSIHLTLGKPVFRRGFVLAATALTCAALQADHEDQHGMNAEKFIQKAAAGGQMEVQMGQLAQTQAQSDEVKNLGAILARDHSQANQKLQQLAQNKNIQVDLQAQPEAGKSPGAAKDQVGADTSKYAKHQQALTKLQSQSGAEFDKEFVRMAIKDHKKDIAEFEKARTELNDPEIKAFIDESLPKLRNHLQVAQSAARTVGVDESTIAADINEDADTATAVGAPAATTRGSDKASSPVSNPANTSDQPARTTDPSDKDRTSINNNTQYRSTSTPSSDASTTINPNNASVNANVAGQQFNAQADVNQGTASVTTQPAPQSTVINPSVQSTAEQHSKFFQKGDKKVLGLSTDKNDGKFWGFIPNPRAKKTTNP